MNSDLLLHYLRLLIEGINKGIVQVDYRWYSSSGLIQLTSRNMGHALLRNINRRDKIYTVAKVYCRDIKFGNSRTWNPFI